MAGEDRAYCRWIRTQPCLMSHLSSCFGLAEADHAGRRPGMALKCHDHETIPLCHKHHMERHALSGAFKGWDRRRWREWADHWIAEMRSRWSTEKEA